MEQQKPQELTQEEIEYLTEKLGYEPGLKWAGYLLKEDGYTLDEIVESLEFL